jgi:hypothetical protein
MFGSNRWFLLIALLVAGALWLAVASVFSNAVHTLWKSSYSWRGFGSVSMWLVALGLVWLFIVGYALRVEAWIPTRNLVLSICIVLAWIMLLAVLTALASEMLIKIGAAAIIVWVIEFVVALFLMNQFGQTSLPFHGIKNDLALVMVTLTWSMAAKVILLCLSPGVTISV